MVQIVQDLSTKSPFISHSRTSDAASSIPTLGYLRFELSRARPGMSDFLIRVSTPKRGEIPSSVITVRGTKDFAARPTLVALGKALAAQFIELKDTSHKWDTLDTDHLAGMLEPSFKLFIKAATAEILGFSTDALR